MIAYLLRFVGSIVAALVVGFILVIAVEFFGNAVHPFPPDFDGSMEEMCAHVARFPAWVLAVCLPMWAFTALVSTWIAGRLGIQASAIVVGLLLIGMVLINISMLPYPLWFKGGSVVAVLLAVVWACQLTRIRAPAPADAPR